MIFDGRPREELLPIHVKNRDIPLLADTWRIMQDAVIAERNCEWQHDRMVNISQHLTGMPGGDGMPKGIDNVFAQLSEKESQSKEACKAYLEQLKVIEDIMNTIPSENMRTFVQLKYIMNRSDVEIRNALNISRRDYDKKRKLIEDASCMAEVEWVDKFKHNL